jgi:hypothetical protein
MDEPRRKSMQSVEVKADDSGQVEAVFATLGVVDHDGDVLTKGAFTDGAPVVISAYGHRSHIGELPIGKGRIVMSDTEARLHGQFFLDTTHGLDAFRTVKALSDGDSLQEWSFSLRDIESHTEKVDGRDANVITKVSVKEVSPVLEGAGIATRTLAAKNATTKRSARQVEAALLGAGRARWEGDEVAVADWDGHRGTATYSVTAPTGTARLVQVSYAPDGANVTLGDDEADVDLVTEYVPKGARFVDQAAVVLADLTKLTERAIEVAAMRGDKGKGLSAETVVVLAALQAQADKLKTVVEHSAAVRHMLTPLMAMLAVAELETVAS